MSKSIQDTKDIFSTSRKNTNRFSNQVKKTTPKYHQSMVNTQQDYVDVWRSVINSTILLEQEYAKNVGYLTDIPESAIQTIHEMTEASILTYLQQNQLIFDTTKITKRIFDTFIQNTKSFSSLNKEIMEYLIEVFEQK